MSILRSLFVITLLMLGWNNLSYAEAHSFSEGLHRPKKESPTPEPSRQAQNTASSEKEEVNNALRAGLNKLNSESETPYCGEIGLLTTSSGKSSTNLNIKELATSSIFFSHENKVYARYRIVDAGKFIYVPIISNTPRAVHVSTSPITGDKEYSFFHLKTIVFVAWKKKDVECSIFDLDTMALVLLLHPVK